MTRGNLKMLFCCSAEANWWRLKMSFTKASHAPAAVATWLGAKDDMLAFASLLCLLIWKNKLHLINNDSKCIICITWSFSILSKNNETFFFFFKYWLMLAGRANRAIPRVPSNTGWFSRLRHLSNEGQQQEISSRRRSSNYVGVCLRTFANHQLSFLLYMELTLKKSTKKRRITEATPGGAAWYLWTIARWVFSPRCISHPCSRLHGEVMLFLATMWPSLMILASKGIFGQATGVTFGTDQNFGFF